MFIKWRVYQRQKYNKKDDKYFLQPVLVHSIRTSKKQVRKWADMEGIPEADFNEAWKTRKDKINRPRHFQLFRFLPFPSCAYVHYDDPNWIEQRKHYWEGLEILFEHNHVLSELATEEKQRILDEIESILPKPYGELLDKLEWAYKNGMPKDPSPKEYYEHKKV